MSATLVPIREERDPALQTVVELVERLLAQAETPAQRAMLTRYIERQLERAICSEVTRYALDQAEVVDPFMVCCRPECNYVGRESRFKQSPRGRKYNAGHYCCPACLGSAARWGNRYLPDDGA